MIAAAKLVANDAVPKEYLGSEIISHFVMHGPSVSEIVKHLIAVLKRKEEDISVIFLDSLKRTYQRHLLVVSTSNDESLSTKTLQDCKDLATRLSGLFVGASRNKHKSEILKIVTAGIEYSFLDAPKHLSFLDGVVLHFVSKLPTTDILDVLKSVQERVENVNMDEDPSGWRPYYAFFATFNEKYAKNEDLQDEKEGSTVRRRGRPRKNQNVRGKKLFDKNNSSEEEDSISESDQFAEGEEEKQEEDDGEVPLIRSFKSSAKLRSLRVSKDENRGQIKIGDSNQGAEDLAASRT